MSQMWGTELNWNDKIFIQKQIKFFCFITFPDIVVRQIVWDGWDAGRDNTAAQREENVLVPKQNEN